MEQFRLAVTLNPGTAEGWISLAIAYLQQEDLGGAEEVLKRAVLDVPDEARLWHLLGVTHLRQEDYRLSVGDLERARTLDEDNVGILRDLANVYERAGYFHKSVQLFEEILRRRPDDHWALNYLGYMLADAGVRLRRAEELVERALRLDPENPYYLDSMGWVYFRLGQANLAERYLLDAAERSPDQAVIHDHLGDLYELMGRMEKARDAWRRALELAPGDGEIQRKLGRLEPGAAEDRRDTEQREPSDGEESP
jgi:tetratricopeptide (TPR) repeat protein